MQSEESKLLTVLLASDIKLELIRLFRTSPQETFSINQIAEQIGITKDEVQRELDDLLVIGSIKKIGNSESFCLDEEKDGKIQAQISRHLLKGADWTIRNYCERFC